MTPSFPRSSRPASAGRAGTHGTAGRSASRPSPARGRARATNRSGVRAPRRPWPQRLLLAMLMAVVGVASGVLTWWAFPPHNAWWAAPLGMALFLLLTSGGSAWRGAGRGLTFGIGFFTPLLQFTAVSMGNDLGWVALTLIESLYLAGCGATWSLISRLEWLSLRSHRWRGLLLQALSFALTFTGWEEIRCRWPWGGFPFGRLAFSTADAPYLPLGAYLGSPGLTALVALMGALLALALISLLGARASGFLRATCAVCLTGLLGLAPLALPLDTQPEDGTVRIAAVQGDVAKGSTGGDTADAAFGRALEVTGNHATATEELAGTVGKGSVDMVIWPENAADRDPRQDVSSAALVEQASQAIGAPIVLGAVPYEGEGASRIRYNDMVVWTPGVGAGEYYRKHQPVPFGEYVPLRSLLRKVTTQVDRVAVDMLPGSGPHTLTVHAASQNRDVRLAMGICFEVAYDSALRAGMKEGGEVIVIPTNNASFGSSSEASQQLAQGRVQAVIHGRTVVQVSTVGLTAVISPKGGVLQQLAPYTRGSLVADVDLRTSQTVADRLGDIPAWLALAATAALTVAGASSTLRQRKKHR